ncbi:F0F1 ATP synthase subunit B [Mycoplasma zalophi]|uniref:ATP synthase subunit b n=1 Tax=Mycoplasma zalophi TaxID=191287 RepID=A0ABS6DPG0_9MOLU|nr:F0F1 ATP synthase subunit B [Mycoplasma zalophi]MBU4692209.1 F0F1 ATP synthase subunit B [Mycoplasma zalophi]
MDKIIIASEQSEGVTSELNKVFNNFAWQWPYFIFTIVSLLITVLVLTFLVYKPVKKMLNNRQNYIQQNIDDSVKAKEKALELQVKANEALVETYKKADQMIHDAKTDGEKIIDSATKTANKKAHGMIEQTNNSISKSWKEFEQQQKKIIVDNAVEIAKKIIGREIKDPENKKMIEQLLEEAK